MINVNPDCRYYTGYKPCGKQDDCGDCPSCEPWTQHILVIKLAAIGDVLRTTTLLPALKKRDPGCCITWLTDPSATPLLKHNPMIDRLYAISADGITAVHATEYDLVLNFEKEARALGVMRTVAAARRKGFAPSRSGTPTAADSDSDYALELGLNDELKFRTNTKTYPQIIYEMAGLPYGGEEYILELGRTSLDFCGAFAARHGLDENTTVIGLNTGCGEVFPTKRWTVDGFVDLVDELAPLPQTRLLLLGGPLEVDFNNAILGRAGSRLLDTGCDNSMEAFLGIIECCDLVVTADSLAMHLAIGRKKQVVALFGPTSHTEVDLFGRGEKVVTDFPCACCYKPTCDVSPSCMESLRAATVAEAVRRCRKRIMK